MNLRDRRKQVSPVGSGYYVLVIIGTVLTVFAIGLVAFEYGDTIIDTFLADKPCLLWAFVIILLAIGFTLTWLGERQGRKQS